MIEVRETELSAQGGKSVKTESALQLVTTSNSNSSNVVSGCRYLKSVKTPKAGVTIRKKPRQRPISIAASSPDKAQISSKKMAKRLKEKGVLISVENQKRPHEKRPEKIKRSKEHVNLFDDQGTFNFSSKEKVMFAHITGRDEVMVIDCVSHDFDQTTFQPSINNARWRDIAANLLRLTRSRDSDFADADENLASQHVTFGIQTSPSELNTQNTAFSLYDNQDNSVEASEASTLTDSLPDLLPYDDEASMNETSDLSEVSVNEVSGSLSTVL